MKISPRHRRSRMDSVAGGRWAAYAAAGVATTIAVAPSAEAEVHYSGIVKYDFAAHGGQGDFPLDPGVELSMRIGLPATSIDAFGHVVIHGADRAFVGRDAAYTSPFAVHRSDCLAFAR